MEKHSAASTQVIARYLIGRGIAPSEVFVGTGLDVDFLDAEFPVVDFAKSLRLFERGAVLANDDALGFRLGQEQDIRAFGLLSYVALASPTVAEAMVNVSRYCRAFNDAKILDVSQLNDIGTLDWHFNVSPRLARRQFVEFSTASSLAALRHYSDHHVVPVKTQFQHNRRRSIAFIEGFLGCPAEFGAAVNRLVFDQQDLKRPLTSADPHLLRALTHYGDQVLQAMRDNASKITADVENMISKRLGKSPVTMESVAHAMGMSPRTLSRKLTQENTRFSHILEDLRKTMAMNYLQDSDLLLAEIAFLLGYSSLNSFNEAFKRWTGSSPGLVRAKLRR